MPAPAVRIYTRPDAVAVLTIDQTDRRVNVLTADLWAELETALDALAARADLKGLVIASGKPGVFIAGADLNVFVNATLDDPAVRAYMALGSRVLGKLESLPFPTCAAIDGAALGGGLEVALACDSRVAGTHPKVRLGLPEVTLGLIPGWGGTQRLSRVVGLATAGRMLITGDSLTAAESFAAGLSDRPPGEPLLEMAAELVLTGAFDRAAKQRPLDEAGTFDPRGEAAGEVIRVMTAGSALPLADGIALETEAFLRLAGSDGARRRVAAFFAGRKK